MPPIEIERHESDDRIEIYLIQSIDEHTNRVSVISTQYRDDFWYLSINLPGVDWVNNIRFTLQSGQKESFYIELAKGMMTTLCRVSLDVELRDKPGA